MILKGYDFGEADRILTLFTPHLGKLGAIAKGVRKVKSRKAGHVDLFTQSSLFLARGRDLDVLTQAEMIESFAAMRTDLARSTHAHYVAELVDNFAPERMPNLALYKLAVETFGRLARAPNLELVMRSFELHLLGVTGYRPQLFRCISCSTSIQPDENRFSSRLGGILCPDCATEDAVAPAISIEALKALRNLQNNESAMLRLQRLDDDVETEIERRLQEYISYRLESRPRSLGFLERMKAEGMV